MKYRCWLFFLSIIALFLLVVINEKTLARGEKVLGVRVSSREEIAEYLNGKRENKEVYHYPILFNGNNLPYDWTTNTIYIPQNIKSDNYEGRLESQYGNLYWENDAATDCLDKHDCIAGNTVFKLYLIWDKGYSAYNVIFTGMPTMSLTYDNYNPETMSWDGNIVLTDPYHKKNEYIMSKCEYHLRGDSTSHADKKSYELNLNDKFSLLGMRKDDDWALVAMLGDNGFVHNKLAYDLWNEISSTNENPYDSTVNSEFIEVFYDNTYVGLYLLCEKVDRKQCNLTEGDFLYRLNEMKFEEDTLPLYDKQYDYQIKWPKNASEEDYEIINKFERTFYSKEEFDLTEAQNIIDLDNITDINLYSMLICGVDNWDANCFYIAPRKDDYRISEVMWDMNETFGDDEWFEFREEYITDSDMMVPYVKKMYDADQKKMSSIMYKRWRKLRKNIIDKSEVIEKAQDMEKYIKDSGALIRETEKWSCYVNAGWEYSNLYRFIDERIDYLDAFWLEEYKKCN